MIKLTKQEFNALKAMFDLPGALSTAKYCRAVNAYPVKSFYDYMQNDSYMKSLEGCDFSRNIAAIFTLESMNELPARAVCYAIDSLDPSPDYFVGDCEHSLEDIIGEEIERRVSFTVSHSPYAMSESDIDDLRETESTLVSIIELDY